MTHDTINDTDRIRSALSYIDAADRDVWLRMGMAIKAELGEHGFDTWDAWGQTADNYSATDSKTVWRSIRPDGKVGIGSLFHEAKQQGWQDDGRRHTLTPAEIAERQRAAAERAAADAADRILLVSPVYFYALSAQCKLCGDRFQARWSRKYLLKERFRQGEGRKGYLLSTSATKGLKIFDCSILI